MSARRAVGFTLVEVLVALALVASALGGALMVVREAARTEQYLERRQFALWVADNVLGEFLLEARTGETRERRGQEAVLGRTYAWHIVAEPLAEAETDGPSADADSPTAVAPGADDGGASDGTVGLDGTTAEPGLGAREHLVVVEVRDGAATTAPLARLERRARLGRGA